MVRSNFSKFERKLLRNLPLIIQFADMVLFKKKIEESEGKILEQ